MTSLNNAQLVAPSLPPSPEEGLPPNFRCPQNLIFSFECECYFNRIGRLEISEFEVFTCDRRAEAVEVNPGLGRRIARQCERNYGHLTEITADAIRGVGDLIFTECPDVLDKLCPDDPAYEVLECTCFLLQTGKISTTNPQDIEDCNETWGAVTRENRRIRRRRCRTNIKFKDFVGSILGTAGRRCFFFGDENCCSALPL